MKKFGFLFFLIAMVGITLSSSTCRTPPTEVEPIDTLIKYPGDTTNGGGGGTAQAVAGPVRVTVRINTPAGKEAGGATVFLARTLDSAGRDRYFRQGLTNDSGFYVFTDLPVDPATGRKTYFANATFSEGGVDYNSTNGGQSNGPVEISLTKGNSKNPSVIVTSK
ncbi:MAG: hypothetical protein EOP53_14140 [Sphingobacteriales bacterium]|nr:MAG: hypothetical protein EOP53_14140 [Sphingobacteriales bacterium]